MTEPILRPSVNPDLKAIREKALGKVPHGAGTDPVCLNLPEVLALLDYTEALIDALRTIAERVARCPICNAVLSSAHPHRETHAADCIYALLPPEPQREPQ